LSLAELKQRAVADLRGSWTRARTEPSADVNRSRAQNTYLTNRASNAINVRFDGGRIIGRDGLIPDDMATGKMTMLYQWLAYGTSLGQAGPGVPTNFLVTFENGEIRVRDLYFRVQKFTAAAIAGAYGATVVEAADRLYISTYKSDFTGASEVRILYPTATTGYIDKAFMGPMTNVPTLTEPYAGLITAGAHKWGYIVTSRSGSQLLPSPWLTNAIFNPVTFTSAPSKTIQVTIHGPWPQDAAYVSAIMTTIENPEKFFIVPGTEAAVQGGSNMTVDLYCSIDDQTLEASGTEILDNFDYMTQGIQGTGPFSPFNLAQLGRRIAYFVGNKVYISDQNDYERVTEAQHVLQVPGQRWLVTAAHIRGVNYFFGPKWTYACVDNEDVPVMWQEPYSVSQSLGSTAIHGVCATTTGDMAWVANEYGLWNFHGAYDAIPVSDMNEPEWKRINWGLAQTTLWIVDDPIAQHVCVYAPLDGATQNTHRLTWSYSRGRGPTEVDFSLDTIPAASAAMVRETTSQRSRKWHGPNAATPILIETIDALDDNGVPIVSVWESGEVFKRRNVASSIDMKIHAVEAKVKGVGILRSRVYEASRNIYEDLATEVLQELPRDAIEMGCDVMSHDATVEFKTSGLGERMDINDFTLFYVPWLTNR